MPKFRNIVSSFLAGEISPKCLGRSETEVYAQACEKLENFLVRTQGGSERRSGTQESVDFDAEGMFPHLRGGRAIPFVLNATQSYIIIFVPVDPAVSSVSALPEDWGIYVWDCVAKDFITVNYGYTQLVPLRCQGFPTQASLNELDYAQYGNGIFFAHGDQPPFMLDFSAGGGDPFFITNLGVEFRPFWAYSNIGQSVGALDTTKVPRAFPYGPSNLSSYTMTISNAAIGTGRTLTVSNVDAWQDKHVPGLFIRVTGDSNATTGVALITASSYPFGTTATVDVVVAFEDTNPSTTYSFAMWNPIDGWPRTVSFYQSRIVYGGSRTFPNTLWAGQINNLANLMQEHFRQDSPNTLTNDDPFSVDVAADELPEIRWLSPGKTLVVGTARREYVSYGPDVSDAWGPLNFVFDSESAIGGKRRRPLRLDNAVIFTQWSGRRIREFLFNELEDSYKSRDISQWGEHMPRRVIEEIPQENIANFTAPEFEHMILQNSDDPVIWFVDRNGGLSSLTRDPTAGVNAFSYHFLGGVYNDGVAGERVPFVHDVCSVPSVDGTHADVYLIVSRSVQGGGVDRTTLEKMGRIYESTAVVNDGTDIESKPVFMDCAVHRTYDPPQNVLDDISQFQFETVDVIADGYYMGRFEAGGGGDITLPNGYEAADVLVGYPYRSTIKTTNINMGSQIGTSQMTPKSVDTIGVRFDRTIGGKVGSSLENLEEIDFRPATLPMNEPIPFYSGDKELTFSEGWEEKLHVYVVQDQPWPMVVTAIVSRGVTND